MSKTLAVCPGTFDPMTNGHVNIIKRSLALFDHVVVLVTVNVAKQPLFTVEERIDMIEAIFSDDQRISIETLDGLLAPYARSRRAAAIVRGLRAPSDFEYELKMAQMNRHLQPAVDTVFLATEADGSFVSSSLVKEVASLGGDVSQLVPAEVMTQLKRKIASAGSE